MSVVLGIDTGGTYTDAVLLEYETNRILASAKALTTKHNLAIGIRKAMENVLAARPADVRLVSLSTTLATNAIVEGNGAPICALLIGYQGRIGEIGNLEGELGTSRYALIRGGHQDDGTEWEPLDLEAARAAILEHAPHVAAYAISGYFGTRNPAHELAVKRLVMELTGKPATCGHELTHRLDALRRATTVALNARLIPLLCELIQAVEQTMVEKGIQAPLMVVKGDGSLMSSVVAKERPVETILSGPAASVVGAQHLVGGDTEDLIMVDMGGTTTDIAVLSQGRPVLSRQGASVGRWRTMVEAIDVHTVGLGGDSRVWLDEERTLHVGPRRVVPLCMLAAEHPQVVDLLRQQRAQSKKNVPGRGEFLFLQRPGFSADGDHPPFEEELMAALRAGPCPLDQVRRIMRYPEIYASYLDLMERQGILMRAGLTPTDAAHVLGHYLEWDQEAAYLGAELLAAHMNLEVNALCERVLRLTSERIATEVVTKLLRDEGWDGHHDVLDDYLVARALRPLPTAKLQCSLVVRPPIVAIGAPVRTYFPLVSELLHSPLRIPEHAEVANAIGAVVGSVVQRVHILIVPREDEGGFRVHLPDHVRDFTELEPAVAYAEEHGRRLASEGARRAGAAAIRIQVERHDQTAPVATGWGEDIYLQTVLEVTAVGRPQLAYR